jgi:hypothetical protein
MNSSHLNSCPALEASNYIVEKNWDAEEKMALRSKIPTFVTATFFVWLF